MTENDVQTINCNFASENALYMAYMPFLRGGGLFIRTNHNLALGTQVKLAVSLLTEADSYTIDTSVVWVTPRGAQGNKPAGVGLQFMGENCRHFTNKIETYLADMLKSTQITDTM